MKRWLLTVFALALACGNADETTIKTLEDDLQEGDRVMVNGEELVALAPVLETYHTEMDAWFDEEPAALDKAAGSLTVGSPFATTYILPNGYGIAGDQGRCNSTSFPGGTCKVPKQKFACIRQLSNQKTPPTAMRNAAAGAYISWMDTMDLLGWTTLWHDSVCGQITNGRVTIRWGNLPAGVGGKMTPLISSGDLVNVPQGQLQPWKVAQITLDPSEIAAMPGYSSKTQTQKNRFARNITIHELFHAGGLGHNTIIDTLMDFIVLQPPPVSSYFTADLSALGAEQTLIQDYEVED